MRRALQLIFVLGPCLLSCRESAAHRPPPPLPVPVVGAPEVAADPAPTSPQEASAKVAPRPARKGDQVSPKRAPAVRVAKTSARAPIESSPPPAVPRAGTSAAPASATPGASPRTAAPAAAAKPAGKVTIPRTAHVRAEVPPGLQRDLNADPRMQSWLDRVFAVIDQCHARDRSVRGTLEAILTMHENERPDADFRALPPALSGVVACSTGALMRIKMPLFTGVEGTRYTVRITFE